ncbi:MAG: 30S ribosomal protein S8 [Chloroflexi bacterium]|nr:30S ribosomal protein S8 [Chloroflexota bacterium]
MTISDPIADMLTRVRNAVMVKHDTVLVPASKIKISIAKILKEEGFISNYEVVKDGPRQVIKIYLKYGERKQPVLSSLERVSKPGLRVYVEHNEIPRVRGGLGIAIVSTSKGVMTGQQAWTQGIGGEVLCYLV